MIKLQINLHYSKINSNLTILKNKSLDPKSENVNSEGAFKTTFIGCSFVITGTTDKRKNFIHLVPVFGQIKKPKSLVLHFKPFIMTRMSFAFVYETQT